MLQNSDISPKIMTDTDWLSGLTMTFTHPDDVLRTRALNASDKRAVLAGWASDAHAVPDKPALRQLDSGAVVSIDSVLDALRTLDARDGPAPQGPAAPGRASRLRFSLAQWRRPPRDDGDDDPPPCPAAAPLPGVQLELWRRRNESWQLTAA